MTDRRPLGLPEFRSPQTEDAELPAARRRLPVECGDLSLAPPAPAVDGPVPGTRRALGDGGGISFSTSDQQR
jgi:hypothetical protein